jgi:hypothetical protein
LKSRSSAAAARVGFRSMPSCPPIGILYPLRCHPRDRAAVYLLTTRFSNPVNGSFFLAKGDHPAPQDVLDQIPLHEINSVDVQHQLIDAGAQADEPEHQGVGAQSSSLLVISTIPLGYNSGRKYCFRLAGQEDADEWQKELNALVRMARQHAGKQNTRSNRGSKAQPLCFHARALGTYKSTAFQGCVAVLIAVGCGLDLTEVLFYT